MIPISDLPKLCSNNKCRKIMDVPRKAWTCEKRSVELCEGCFVAFSVGKFCEIYHDKSNGWKRCISCEKPIHYGCIVSQSSYVLSKPRGIKCLDCMPQHEILMAKGMSSPGTFLRPNVEGTTGNSTGKTAPILVNSSNNRPQLEPTTPSVGRLTAWGYVPSPPLVEKMNDAERLVVGSSKITAPKIISGVKIHSKELTTPSPTPLARVPPTVVTKDQEKVSEKGDERPTPPPLFLEYNKGKSSTEAKARNRKPRSEHRYVPRLTEQELKQMSRGSNVEVTPLFEKELTVSDTGKIGRLVLPKKCAEGHFPSIDIPEGKPLVFQDVDGKDWEFNFRYWPNNNSRMYVLEGFNSYVTSMKLQQGDTVMFGRLEPEGKLVMGHRKGTGPSSSNKVGLFGKAKISSPSSRKAKMNMITGSTSMGASKGTRISAMFSTFRQEKQNDLISVNSDVVVPKSSIIAKRKRSEMGMATESTTNVVLMDKTTSTMPSKFSQEKQNDPISVHSDVVGPKSSILAKTKSSEMGMVTKSTTNVVLKDKTKSTMPSKFSQEKQNDPISVHSDVVGPKSSILVKTKSSEVGMVTKSTINVVLKDKKKSIMRSKFSQEKQNDPISVQSNVVGLKSSILAKRKRSEMGIVTESTANVVLKDKTTSTMPSTLSRENPNDLIHVHPDVLGSESPILATRKNSEMSMLTAITSRRVSKPMTILALPCVVSQEKGNDSTSVHSNVVRPKVPVRRKRNQSEIGLTSKSIVDHESKMANLVLSFQGGQELMRSRPGSNPPSKMVFEGVKLKSYKDDPIIGRPSMFTKLNQDIVQWAQCEKCYKWRKVPIEVEMPANWTCRQNHWDPLRLRCSAKEELTPEMIKNIFPANNQGSSKKIKTGHMEPDRVETVEGRNEVAVTRMENAVAIPEPPKANKKHPRHRPGCTCIVCMQAPSGSKHKPSCECCSCTIARRRQVLNPRRGKKRSKYARRKPENTRLSTSSRKTQKTLPQPENVPKPPEIGTSNSNHQMVVIGGSEGDQNAESLSGSSPKLLFDLNLPPEPDEGDIDTVVHNLENPPCGGNI